MVNGMDLLAARRQLGTAPVPLTSVIDFNRDGRVNALDVAAVRGNYYSLLVLIHPPAAAATRSRNTATSTRSTPSSVGSGDACVRSGVVSDVEACREPPSSTCILAALPWDAP